MAGLARLRRGPRVPPVTHLRPFPADFRRFNISSLFQNAGRALTHPSSGSPDAGETVNDGGTNVNQSTTVQIWHDQYRPRLLNSMTAVVRDRDTAEALDLK